MRAWRFPVTAAVGLFFLASSASHAGTVYACRKKAGGTIRIVGAAATCLATEVKMSWPNANEAAALEAQVAALETQAAGLTAQVTALATLLEPFSRSGNDVAITGANLWIKSGAGATDAPVNGLGNLIVGYNEGRYGGGDVRTGSHNLVVGAQHNYSSYGGLVVGLGNTISGIYASVSGGSANVASAPYSSVSGGGLNTASGSGSSVSGGGSNTASGDYSWVGGGEYNTASGTTSSISGGFQNTALGTWTSVSGGANRTAPNNQADWVGGLYWSDN